MTQIVTNYDGTVHEFPDDATQEEMSNALNSHETSSKKQSNEDSFGIDPNRTIVDSARDLAQGALTGLGKGGQAIAGAISGGHAPKINMDEYFSPIGSKNEGESKNIVKGIGSYLPYGLAGGASLLGQVAAGAVHGGLTTEPEEQNLGGILPNGRIGGAIEEGGANALLGGAFKALPYVAKGIKNLKDFSPFKDLSPLEEAKIAQQEKTNLASKQYEEAKSNSKTKTGNLTPEALQYARDQAAYKLEQANNIPETSPNLTESPIKPEHLEEAKNNAENAQYEKLTAQAKAGSEGVNSNIYKLRSNTTMAKKKLDDLNKYVNEHPPTTPEETQEAAHALSQAQLDHENAKNLYEQTFSAARPNTIQKNINTNQNK